MSNSDWGEQDAWGAKETTNPVATQIETESLDSLVTAVEQCTSQEEPEVVEVEQVPDEPMFLPLYCNNCIRCTHLVGPLGKKAGDCMEGNPNCPAHDVQLGVGVSPNLVPEYVRALSEGDLPCLGSINAKLEDAHPIAVREFLKEVRSETALSEQ